MYKANIISAGKMMAIVVMLFGVLHCIASFSPSVQEGLEELAPGTFEAVPFFSVIEGALLVVLGLLLLAMFAKAEMKPVLGTPILIIGTLVAVCGILSVAFVYRNPFSWMTAILGLAVFIDSLCLKLLDRKK